MLILMLPLRHRLMSFRCFIFSAVSLLMPISRCRRLLRCFETHNSLPTPPPLIFRHVADYHTHFF